MTDAAESQVRRWALRKNGEELTVKDAVELVLAVDEDAVERHEETVDVLKVHCTEAVVRDLAIRELQDWRRESSENCQRRIEAIVKAEHEERHAAYESSLTADPRQLGRDYADPVDSQFGEHRESAFPLPDPSLKDIIVGWRAGKWLLGIFLIALIGWGFPFWADSCASQRTEKMQNPTVVRTVYPSPSVTP